MLVWGVQHRDLWGFFFCRLCSITDYHKILRISLCYMVSPCCFSILCLAVWIYLSHPPNLSLLPSLFSVFYPESAFASCQLWFYPLPLTLILFRSSKQLKDLLLPQLLRSLGGILSLAWNLPVCLPFPSGHSDSSFAPLQVAVFKVWSESCSFLMLVFPTW